EARPQGDHRSARRAQGIVARSLARRRSRARQQGVSREQRGAAAHGPPGIGEQSVKAGMIIMPGDFENAQLLALLRLHLAGMHANSPPGGLNAFDLSGLKASDISIY